MIFFVNFLVGFFQLKDLGGKNKGIPLIIKIFSAFMLIGLIFTFLLPETKGKTLEQLNGEAFDEAEHKEKKTLKDRLKMFDKFNKKMSVRPTNKYTIN